MWNTGAALWEQLKGKSLEKNRKGLEFCLVVTELRKILVKSKKCIFTDFTAR